MTSSSQELESRRKRLLWRASHRGIKEMDVLMGGFTRDRVNQMSETELSELEALIDVPDHDLLSWITGEAEVPEQRNSGVLRELLRYRP
jgi:antitoxin CptB